VPIDLEILRNQKDKNDCKYFFETGLYHATTLEKAVEVGFQKYFSIELYASFCEMAKEKFPEKTSSGEIMIINDDSANMKNYIGLVGNNKTLFWLDAHAGGPKGSNPFCNAKAKIPIEYELQAIKLCDRKDHVILVDDLRIMGKTKIEQIKKMILEINPLYKFSILENPSGVKDILCAVV